jgi:hypothetical protein
MATKPIEMPGVKMPPPMLGAVGNPTSTKMSSFKTENKNAIKTVELMRFDAAEAFLAPNPTKVFESETGRAFDAMG